MPASAYALLAVFIGTALGAGVVAARIIGPWRRWTAVVPALAAFGALYLVGHRYVVSIGPQVRLFDWDVALPFDVAVALGTAMVTALVQRGALGLLQGQQRRAGGDGLA